jgi:hypothetical protein
VLVLTGLGREQLREHSHEADGLFHITVNLQQAVEMILQGLLACNSHISTEQTSCYHTSQHPLATSPALLRLGGSYST